MIKFFPELRRRRSDGLASALGIEDYRDPFEIQFGLFGDDDAGGGSDNVDRSNPNEMAARERAAARAGTVTDGKGNPVTSVNPDGSRSVVTTGTQAQQVAAREAFNATDPRASDTRSNYAQAQYDEVAARETAALNRAAEAGRLASASLANVGDVTKAQPYTTYLDDELAFTQGMGTAPVNTGFADAETARVANLTPDEAAAQGVTVAEQRAAQAAVRGQTVNPVTGALEGTSLIDIFSETDLDPAAGQEAQRARAQQEMDLRAQALSTIQNNLGITSASQATAANVLGTSPSDMARIATADAAMDPSAVQVFDASPNAMDAGDMMLNPGLATGIGSLPTPGGTVRDLQAQRQLQGPPQFIEETRNAARTISSTGQPLEAVSGFLDYPGTVFDRPTSSLVQAGTTMGPQQAADAAAFAAQQADASTLGLSPGALGGRIAAPLPDMIDAETDMVARDLTDPNRPGYRDGLPIGLETYTRPDGVTLTTNLAGLTEEQRANQPFSMDVANFMGSEPYGYELDNQGNVIGQVGTPGMSLIGNAVTGLQNMLMGPPETVEDLLDRGAYTGMSLSGSDDGGGGGEQIATKAPTDPCPEGYQMVDGVCTPVDDVTADEPAAPGSNFVINPTTGLPTLFQPTTQATQVGQINPFVLQPYTPMQAQNIQQARSGIQALSPTGAALGRQV